MENSNMGMAQVSQDQEICLEDFRRIVTDAYLAGYQEGLSDSQFFTLGTPPNLSERELYLSRQRLWS